MWQEAEANVRDALDKLKDARKAEFLALEVKGNDCGQVRSRKCLGRRREGCGASRGDHAIRACHPEIQEEPAAEKEARGSGSAGSACTLEGKVTAVTAATTQS